MENLWMNRENPVHKLTAQIFLRRVSPMIAADAYCGSGLRATLRLIEAHGRVKSPALHPSTRQQHHEPVHHIDTIIAGRPYRIEVTAVGGRWRAHLQRTLGMPTALMPFYGATPEEAAGQLTRWLTLAHGRQPVTPAAPPSRPLRSGRL